jgi:hypothetical protein
MKGMRGKIRYTAPAVTRLGKVEQLTQLIKVTGPGDILAKHRLIG